MMENLSISDGPGGSQSGMVLGPQNPPPQLPPQMFTTAAQLLDLTDKKLVVALRDGMKLIGVLRSWDQFANLVLQSTIERIFLPPAESSMTNAATEPPRGLYADIDRGTFLVRGENVVMLGEIDLDQDDDPPPGYDKAELAVVEKAAKERKEADKSKNKSKTRKLAMLGFEGENYGEILL